MSKRKRVVLTFQQKLDILRQLEEGKSNAILAKEYGIGTSTISDIKRNAGAILQFVSNLDCERQVSEKKTRKTAQNTDLDSMIYKWYVEEKEKGTLPGGPKICAKALEINRNLSNANQNFKASPGWLRHFKNRHGIRLSNQEQQEEVTPNVPKQLKSFLKRGGYTLENIYNADEGVLDWKSLPNTESKGGLLNVIFCTNANASHKLPLWLIGQDADVNLSPDVSVVYKHQRSVSMNANLFEDWLENHFMPEVQKRQRNTANAGKVLLIVDDMSWHLPFTGSQNKLDLFFLRNDLDPVIQPSEVGIKYAFKLMYRKKLLQSLRTIPPSQFVKEFTLKDGIALIGAAWDSVPKTSIVQSWGKLMSESKNETRQSHDEEISEIFSIAKEITGLNACSVDNITQWLDGDKEDCFFYTEEDVDFNSTLSDDQQEGPSHLEAYQCLDTVIQWFQQQAECNGAQLSCLQTLHDLAADKLCGNIKQEKD